MKHRCHYRWSNLKGPSINKNSKYTNKSEYTVGVSVSGAGVSIAIAGVTVSVGGGTILGAGGWSSAVVGRETVAIAIRITWNGGDGHELQLLVDF
jgi:hypothetical protein